MLRQHAFLSVFLVAAAVLASCSGPSTPRGGGGGGNATMSLTMIDTPLAGTSIVSFKLTVTGVSLTPSTGKAVNLTLNPTTPIIELTHLQSDSIFLGTTTIPSGNYTSAAVSFSSPDIVLVNQTTGPLTGGTTPCPVSPAPCEFKPAASGMITLTTAPFPLTLSPNQQTGLSLDFNLNNAITMINGAVSVDFTQANVLKASTLPRTGAPSGSLDLIEDFTGVITAVSGNSVTVHSDTKGTITAVANSSTTFNIDPAVCSAQNLTCLGANKTVSIDASLNPDGTMTLREADLLDNASVDEVEGTVLSVNASTSTPQISLVLSDKTVVSGSSVLTAATGGTLVVASLGTSPAFSVDTKGLSAVVALFPGGTGFNFASLANVFAGQTVRIKVTNPTAGPNSSVLVNTNSVVLRFSRVTGTVSIPPAPFFGVSAASLPSFLGGINGLVNIPVQISTQTNFDGVTDATGLSVGDTVSLRALYIPNFLTSPFFAAKVRKH